MMADTTLSFACAVACIRNIDALLALQNYFIASKNDSLREKVRALAGLHG
jgi:hypothetical protein